MNVPFFISIPTLASILNVAYKNIDQHLDFIEFFLILSYKRNMLINFKIIINQNLNTSVMSK